ncbi:MAG: MFS transporter [Saprospiraceae bacterium]|nr:MFS transporter [Saprospiraceae bacterium]
MNQSISPKVLLGCCIMAYVSGGAISMVLSVYLPAIVTDIMGQNNAHTMSQAGPWLNAGYLAGMTVGGLGLGFLSDHLGRVKVLCISLLLCGISTLCAAAVSDWVWLVWLRVFAGVGVSGILITCAVLVSESWPLKNRAVVQGILGVAFPVGIVLSGGLNVFTDQWRNAFQIGWAPILLAPILYFLIVEPANHRVLRIPQNTFRAVFLLENRNKLWRGAAIYGADLVGLWAIFSWMPTWVDSMLEGSAIAGQMRGVTMMILGLGGMIGTGLSGVLVNQLGLRRTLLSNFAVTLVLCLFIFLGNQTFTYFLLAQTVLLSLFFGVSQGALTVFVTELFPKEIRASGTGFCFNTGRVFTTSAVFFVGSLVEVLGGYSNSMLLFSSAFLIAGIILYRSPELTNFSMSKI